MNKSIRYLVFVVLCVGSAQLVASSENEDKISQQVQAILSLEADAEYGEYLAGECLTCHSPTGAGNGIPVIHKKTKDSLANAILEYKFKQRDNNVMQGVTAALSDEEIAALIAYFSLQ